MIRLYRKDDFAAVTLLWFDAMQVAMPALQIRMKHTIEDARAYFLRGVLKENQVWVYEADTVPRGYLAMRGEFIDRLYVEPAYHRQGIGQVLIDFARMRSPKHLWLYTHVSNRMARSFYEKNQFVAQRFGISPAPESEPDVEYHWRGGS